MTITDEYLPSQCLLMPSLRNLQEYVSLRMLIENAHSFYNTSAGLVRVRAFWMTGVTDYNLYFASKRILTEVQPR